MNELKNGLFTGLALQLAIGPIFFLIMNMTLQRSTAHGFAGVFAATLVDYFYISLAILGVGKLLENRQVKKIFGIVSSLVLVIFGWMTLKGIAGSSISTTLAADITGILSSFGTVFLITITSPLTIVFFTGLFTARVIEFGYSKKELFRFGLGTGMATFLFMSASVILFSLIKDTVPLALMRLLNAMVGCLLIGYGGVRLWKILKSPDANRPQPEMPAG